MKGTHKPVTTAISGCIALGWRATGFPTGQTSFLAVTQSNGDREQPHTWAIRILPTPGEQLEIQITAYAKVGLMITSNILNVKARPIK
jgi:hypothetical protein